MLPENFQKSAIPLQELYFLRPYGILDPERYEKFFTLHLYKPGRQESNFIDHYFVSRWDIPDGQTYTASDIITGPAAHLTISPPQATLSMALGKRTIQAKGKGVMTGVKFHPGALHAYNKNIIPQIVNSSVPASFVFPEINQLFIQSIQEKSDKEIVTALEGLLRSHPAKLDPRIASINKILREIRAHKHLTTVSEVAKHCKIPERTLQHLFNTYLGLPPKWFIMRDRLLNALQAVHYAKAKPQWTAIAADLGYSSQAHFTTDFKNTIGELPSEYLKRISLASITRPNS